MACTCFEVWSKFDITEICDDCWDSINNWFGEEEIEDAISSFGGTHGI